MWYPLFKYVLLGPALRLLGRPAVTGLDNIPRTGPVIIAANHLAVIDSLYLALVVPRRVTFLAKQEYFTGKGLRGRFNRWFYSVSGQVPVDRTGGSAAADALAAPPPRRAGGGGGGDEPDGTPDPARRSAPSRDPAPHGRVAED
uniref:lysophospholipid acyltransferase family protein n=1 Tax=Nocardia abscessus TaxID=120957 RepID=UPI00245737F0